MGLAYDASSFKITPSTPHPHNLRAVPDSQCKKLPWISSCCWKETSLYYQYFQPFLKKTTKLFLNEWKSVGFVGENSDHRQVMSTLGSGTFCDSDKEVSA